MSLTRTLAERSRRNARGPAAATDPPLRIASPDTLATGADAAAPAPVTKTPLDAVREAGSREPAGAKPADRRPPRAAPPPRRPFPLDALPAAVRDYAGSASAAVGVCPSLVASALLAVLGSAAGNSRRAGLKPGYSEPLVFWVGLIGESGSGKTPALGEAVSPLRDRQRTAHRVYRDALALYEVEADRHAGALAEWRQNGRAGDPPAAPERPTMRSSFVGDITPEALAEVLTANPRGTLAFADELSGWFGTFGRYNNGGGADAARWLEHFNAGTLRIDRKGADGRVTFIPHAAVSLLGGVQPGTLRRVLTEGHRDSGLAARMLFAWPDPRPVRWSDATVHPGTRAELGELLDALASLAMGEGEDGEPVPVIVPLTGEARRIYAAGFNANGAAHTAAGGHLAAALAKLNAYAARFALLFHLCRDAAGDPTLDHPAGRDGPGDPGEVDADSVRAGWELADWYGTEARRVLALLEETAADGRLRSASQWIAANRPNGVTASELRRSRRHLYASTDEAERELRALAAAGFGTYEHCGPGPSGGRPTDRYTPRPPPAEGL